METEQYNLLDKAISIAIILFILSMISERFITWVKITFGRRGRSLLWFSIPNEDLTTRSNKPNDEKIREQKILGLNIVLSIIIALISHANLFDIIGNEVPYESLGWKNITFCFKKECISYFFNNLLGCILAGFFISLGSKFWHDTLDMLMYSKNLKQKLSDPNTYEVNDIDQLTEYLSFTESDLVKLAIIQNEQYLKTKHPNITYLNDSISIIEGERRDVLGIYVIDDNIKNLPDQIPVKLPSGKIYNVQTTIISSMGICEVTAGMDGSVCHENSESYKGSACCILKDSSDKNYLLTNCHVLTQGYIRNPMFNTGNGVVKYNEEKLGTWYYGSMNKIGDFGIVEIDENFDLSILNAEKISKQTRQILKEDWLKLQVNVRANKCGNRKAYVIEQIENQCQVKYKEGLVITFNTAIMLADSMNRDTCSPVTNFGDSGGAVYDSDNNLIGIITASDAKFSYVLPINDIIKQLKLNIN